MNEGLIYKLIPLVMADIGAVTKDGRNEQQKYAFRGIEQFYEAAHPAFVKHGVFCVPEVVEHAHETFEKPGYEGKTTIWRHVTLKVRHRFYAGDGSYVDVVTCGEGLDNSDKATNKAMSGAMKYALIELFSVPTKDVEDSDRTTPEAGKAVVEKRTFTKPAAKEKKPEAFGPDDGKAALTTIAEAKMEAAAEIEYCTKEQQDYLRLKFKDALAPNLTVHADQLRRDFLKLDGFYGEDGVGTSKRIPRLDFKLVCSRALKYAKELGS